MKTYTLEDLKAMTPERRLSLYQNAKERLGAGGQEIMDLIDNSGLPLSSGGLQADDPLYLEMEEIIWSEEGRTAALAATTDGRPALSGIDPLLKRKLGDRYGPYDQGTLNAGYIVAGLMRHLGYHERGQGKCADGCVAKTGIIWEANPRKG
jgi:hypothetical protein